MESDDIRQALREADRAEAAPWTDYPPTPRWYPVATGTWAALLTLSIGLLDEPMKGVGPLVVVELLFLAWYRRYRGGVLPTGAAPREFRRAIWAFVLAIAAVVAGVLVLSLLVSVWAGALLALAGVTAVVSWYERAYADAARRARERLA